MEVPFWFVKGAGYALGYFEAWDVYSMEAVAEAAEPEQAPVVLGFGGMMMESAWLDRYGIDPPSCRMSATATLRRNLSDMPMIAEAELGRLPYYGEDDSCVLADPEQAADFVSATGVDCLAVSIGNVHLCTDGESTVDLNRLRAIRSALDVPLVIHGGSGFPTDVVRAVVEVGVSLFHVGSIMKRRFFEETRSVLLKRSETVDYQAWVGSRKDEDFLLPGKHAVQDAVRRKLCLYGAAGRHT